MKSLKRAAVVFLFLFLLSGCAGQNKALEQGLKLRTQLLKSGGCTFDADITADYGDTVRGFSLQCQADEKGTIQFSVLKPDSIAGIAGTVDGEDGTLSFESTILHFPLLADQQVTPVSAPWLLMKTLRSGYITSAGSDGDSLRLSIDDSYQEDALHLDIWLNQESIPTKAEILFRERKILSLDVKNFKIE